MVPAGAGPERRRFARRRIAHADEWPVPRPTLEHMSPAASRPTTATTLAVPRLRPAWDGVRERAVSVLTDPALSGIVDLVAWRDGDDLFVANAAGQARTTMAGGRPTGEPGEPGTQPSG